MVYDILVLTIALHMLLSFPEYGDSLSLIVESTVYQNMNPAPYQRVGSKNIETYLLKGVHSLVVLYLRFGKWNIVNLFHMCLSDVFFLAGEHPNPLVYHILSSFPLRKVTMFPSWRWALDVANAAPLCPALLVFWPMGRCLHPVETGSLNSDLHKV